MQLYTHPLHAVQQRARIGATYVELLRTNGKLDKYFPFAEKTLNVLKHLSDTDSLHKSKTVSSRFTAEALHTSGFLTTVLLSVFV